MLTGSEQIAALAEIERLTRENARIEADARAHAAVCLSEENDALIEGNKRLTREIAGLKATLCLTDTEINRLDVMLQTVIRERDEARAEATRLRSYNAGLAKISTDLERQRDEARAVLEEVRAATCMPLPDPGAHSWRAFYDAACTRLTRCANAARRGLRPVDHEQQGDGNGKD